MWTVWIEVIYTACTSVRLSHVFVCSNNFRTNNEIEYRWWEERCVSSLVKVSCQSFFGNSVNKFVEKDGLLDFLLES